MTMLRSSASQRIMQEVHLSIPVTEPGHCGIWCRCNRVDFGDTSQLGMSACNTNASSNYMGSTVLLDVNSNTPGAPPVASAQDCCMACLGNAQVYSRPFFRAKGCPDLDHP